MRTGHTACMGEIRNVYKILVRKPDGREHVGDLCPDGG